MILTVNLPIPLTAGRAILDALAEHFPDAKVRTRSGRLEIEIAHAREDDV